MHDFVDCCDTLGCFQSLEGGEGECCDECGMLFCEECFKTHICWNGEDE